MSIFVRVDDSEWLERLSSVFGAILSHLFWKTEVKMVKCFGVILQVEAKFRAHWKQVLCKKQSKGALEGVLQNLKPGSQNLEPDPPLNCVLAAAVSH